MKINYNKILITLIILVTCIYLYTENRSEEKLVSITETPNPASEKLRDYSKVDANASNLELSCDDYDIANIDQSWATKKESEINEFLAGVIESNESLIVHNEILKGSGVGDYIWRLRGHISDTRPVNPKMRAYSNRTRNQFSAKSQLELETLISNGDIEGIITSVEQGLVLPEQVIYLDLSSGKAPYYPVGILIALAAQKNIAQADIYAYIEKLINAGAKIYLEDLIEATKNNFSPNFMEFLFSLTNDQSDQYVLSTEFDELVSLLTLAIYQQNYELANFWLLKGVPTFLNIDYPSAIDVLSEQKASKEASDLLMTLLENGAIARKKYTIDNLSQWGNLEVTKEQLKRLDTFNTKYLTSGDIRFINTTINTIFSMVISNYKPNELNQANCQRLRARKLVVEIYRISDDIEMRAKIQMPEMKIPNRYDDIDVMALKEHGLSNEEITEKLGARKDIQSKNKVFDYLLNSYLEQLPEAPKERPKTRTEEQKKHHENLMEQGNWQQAMLDDLALNEKELTDQEVLDASLIYALTSCQDTDIAELLNKGATVTPELNFAIVKQCSIKTIARFIDYGVDFSKPLFGIFNGVFLAVMHKNFEAFEYFLSQGISVKPNEYGQDPLDEALKQIGHNQMDFRFVSTLIAQGAPIELSHQEIVLNYAISNSELYALLVGQYPALKMQL